MKRQPLVLIFVACVCGVGAYLLASALIYRIGFPLDDAWIHQTYARNLALYGQWAYFPGEISGGSTSPLWTALLAIGAFLRLPATLWAYLLGFAVLFSTGCVGYWLFGSEKLEPSLAVTGAIFLTLEWHLLWTSVSGMETGLMILAALCVFCLLKREKIQPVWLGILCGVAVWIRPDGLTLIGPALLCLALIGGSWSARIKACLKFFLVFGIFFGCYLGFNFLINGTIWPNTFFAKQSEYAVLLQQPFLTRLAGMLSLPFIGSLLVLIPGLINLLIRSVRSRDWAVIGANCWWVGYILIYVLRLPFNSQHGRYVMPVIGVVFALGWIGTAGLITRLGEKMKKRKLVRFGSLTLGWTITLAFIVLGAMTYAKDVAIIESEMVETARWVAGHVPAEATVAAHDIGALGYYGNHRLVDLAGLISPEVVPFIRDETRIQQYLEEQDIHYLVTFPDWYTELTQSWNIIFTSGGAFAPVEGGENMAVYQR